jgi:outer membrane protein TolC
MDLWTVEQAVQLYDPRRRAASRNTFRSWNHGSTWPEDRWGTKNYWYAGIGITMPIFDGFLTKAKIGQAEAQLHKVKNQSVC